MTGDETRNWFADESLAQDPYPYLAELRSQCPVKPTPPHDVIAVTGYEEAAEILRRHDDFSACVTVVGPFADFPEPLTGDDVSELIERYRHRLPQHDHMVTMDQPAHTRERALLMRLLTPARLREHPERIPNLIEETLRIESPTKTDCRLARRTSTVAGVDVPAGATVAVLLGAANRDPRKFPSPDEFQAGRPNARQHLAFGRGIHTCPGSPLARAEGRSTIERLLRRTRNIRLSEAHHGPAADRRFSYEPTWMLRSMEELHIEFDPCPGGAEG